MITNPHDAPASAGARSDHYAQLRALFEQCADLPEGERLSWIERHVPDESTRVELALMLASDAGAGDLFEAPAMQRLGDLLAGDDLELQDLIGSRCGAFRIERLLGSGGQGAVYFGVREGTDFSQHAAIKLMRHALLDATDLRRFRRERDILARFEHPGVARLIDAGIGESGLPYMAMEYVDGEPIDVWCLQQSADRAQRLGLFKELCDIVAAAHRQLIVHRDLKPSNVMVSNEGAVKVLDFGIARLLDEEAGTHTAAPMLTPGYGAPEQRSGDPATPASDVYALGALLRELIFQQPPPRSVREDWPRWPTDAPDELRWVFARCCAVDPAERYRDAAELGEDIARYLELRPVRAHPPSPIYAARKFVRRHRGGVAISALLLLTTLLGFGAALWQTSVARDQAQRAQATSDFLLGVFQSAQEDLPVDARPTPDALVQVAAARLERDTSLPAAQRADFFLALGHVARYSNDARAALPLYERAIALGSPASRERLRAEVARAWVLNELGRAEESITVFEPRLAAIRAGKDALTVDGLWGYASALGDVGRSDEYLRGLDEARHLSAVVYTPDAIETLRLEGDYALALNWVGRHREAADALGAMFDRWQRAGHPQTRDYAVGLANLGLMQRALGDLSAAEARYREALALSRRIHSPSHPDTAAMATMLGRVLVEQGRADEAEPLLQQALVDLTAALGPRYRQTIGAMSALGLMELERFRYEASVARLQAVADICAGTENGDSANACTSAAQLLADALLRAGRYEEASRVAAQAARQRAALDGEDSPDNAPARRIQAEILLAQGRPAEALPLVDSSIRLYASAGIDQTLDLASQHIIRARALLALGQPREALAALDAAAPIVANRAPKHPARNLRLLAARAAVLVALAQSDEARDVARQAMTLEAARGALGEGEWEALQAWAK